MTSLRGRLARAIACAALLSLAAPSLSAQIVLPNDDPGIEGEGYVTYVGHYGEVFKLVGGWKIQASMHGEAEVINHYPLDYDQPDPKPSDFVPENFTRNSLIQLIILPWSASSSKTLEVLKQQKIADLKASGVNFRILDDPFPGYGHMGRKWPKGTFEVLVATPYLLSQLYTTSGAHLAILTSGVDTPPSYVIASHYDWMRMGLRDWVVPATGREVPQTSGPVPARDIPEEGISLRVFAKPQIWMTWVLVTGGACLILGILGVTKVWDPLRRASLSLLIFSNAGALIGGLVGLCFWPIDWSSPHLPIPSAVACLFMPLLAWFTSRVRGRSPRRWALVGVTAWALAAAALLGYISLVSTLGAEWAPHIPSFTAMVAFAFYAVGGIVFGFLDSDSSEIGERGSAMRRSNQRSFRVVVCAALLSLAAPSLHAQIVLPNDDPGIKGEGYVTYAGHYGEVFKLRGGWKVQASMQGEAEVINHYQDFRFISADLTEPFDPKPEDFVPENFTRDRLIQLIILPWAASSSKSLEVLKPQKIADLKSSGVDFRIIDDPWLGYGSWNQKWPKGTFEVFIATPYRLSQLYTTSGEHLVIFTAGRDTPPSYVITSHSDQVRMSLRDWVAPAAGKADPKTFGPVPARDIPEEGISLRVFAKPQIWMTWVLVIGVACLLLGILGVTKLWGPLRRASLSLLIFSNAGALIGGFVGLCFWPFAWSSPHLPIPSAVACLFMPLLAWLVGRVRGRWPRRRALIGTTAWALAAAAFLVYFSLVSKLGAEWAALVPSFTAIFAFVFYAIGGIIFGFLDSASTVTGGGRALLTLTLLMISSRTIWAQPGPVLIEKATPNPIDSEAAAIAQQKLAKHKLDRDSYWAKAEAKLKETEVLYQYQRVEIKGIFAKDNTDKTLPDLFDEQIEASHLGEKGNDVTNPRWVQDAWNHLKDLGDLHAETYGAFTETAKRTVQVLEGKEINEIVAHSWGSEIVYNAILAGKIIPPRRLIVCGMPDRDKQKWLALSKYTGTEVVVYPNSRDPIAGAARLGGVLLDGAESPSDKVARKRIEDKFDLEGDPVGFEAQWEDACRQRPCNPHSRQPPPPKFKPAYKGPSHNRYLYYRAMLKDGTIPRDDVNAYELRDRQDAKITAEADRLYAAAVGREVANLSPEPAKVKSDKDFLSVWQQDADKIAAQARAVQEAERQSRLARNQERERLEREYQERKKQAFRTEMDAEAAACGYRIRYDTDNKTMLGFGSFILGRHQVPFDFGDLKVVFLMTRACQEIEANANRPAAAACNGAASLLRERVGRGDFVPKLKYLAMYPITGYSMDESECVQELLTNADKINDAKSFDKVTASYQKRLSKRLAKEAKRDREREDRERKEDRGGGSRPPDGDEGPNHFWDPSCNCWVRRY